MPNSDNDRTIPRRTIFPPRSLLVGADATAIGFGIVTPTGIWSSPKPKPDTLPSIAAPVGSSSGTAGSPGPPNRASRTKIAKICSGRDLAREAYNSKSCSPESPIRMNWHSGKLLRTSTTPARLRSAGAENNPLKSERPA